MKSSIAAAIALGLSTTVQASPAALLEERYPQCGDTCYQQVRQNQLYGARSRPACKELFQTTVYPCTVTSTSTVEWVNSYPYGYYRGCGPVSTKTATQDVTLTTVTTTSTSLTVLLPQRGLATKACTAASSSTTAVPSYFSACHAMAYYSSACSCLGAATRSTITKPTPTSTVYKYGCSTTTTSTTTTVATEYSSTETDTVTVTAPTCSATITAWKADGTNKQYSMKYHGFGKVTDPDDWRYNQDSDHTPTIDYLGDSDDDCAMLQQCANNAYQNTDEYYMFDLHYKDSEWVCIQYYQGTGDSSNFGVQDPDARKVYGYQVAYY